MAFCEIQLSTGLVISPDTCELVTHTREAEATDHPVEDGSSIADHVIVKPKTFTLTTNWTPRPWDDTFKPGGANRPQQAFDILAMACQDKTSVWIQVDDIDYQPVIIQRVTMQREFADGDSRTIQLDCKQITVVQGKTVEVKLASSLKAKGKPKRKKVNLEVDNTTAYWFDSAPTANSYWQNGADSPAANPYAPINLVYRELASIWTR
jgi:hypothetical protein